MASLNKCDEPAATSEDSIRAPTTIKSFKVIKRYDPFQQPPDIIMAREHGIAKKVYKNKKEDKYNNDEKRICPCCGLQIVKNLSQLLVIIK